MMIFSKKAQFSPARKQMYFMIIGFVMTVILFGAFFMMNKYKNDLTKYPDELESSLIYSMFVNNPHCFAYQDSTTNRTYPYSVDLSKFNEQRIHDCYPLNREKGFERYNFKVIIEGRDIELKTNNFFNRVFFTKYYDVLIYDNGEKTKDRLILLVQKEI